MNCFGYDVTWYAEVRRDTTLCVAVTGRRRSTALSAAAHRNITFMVLAIRLESRKLLKNSSLIGLYLVDRLGASNRREISEEIDKY